jgi:hypothetical protein
MADASARHATAGRAAWRRRGRIALAVLACALSLGAVPAFAQALRLDYALGLGYLHSDNINLSETDPDSDGLLSPELQFEATQQSSRVSLLARGRLQYLLYRDDQYEDEPAGDFAGRLEWTALPDRLSFVVEDYLVRQSANVAAGFSPDNQEQVNVFIAGPSLFARFGDAMRGQLDVRFADTRAEINDDFDGERYSAAVRLLRELDATQRLSFNAEATDARFDSDDASDYRRYDAFLGYRRESNALGITAAVGYSRLDPQDGTDSESSPLARLQLDWLLGPRQTLDLAAAYSFADTASDLATLGSDPDADLGTGGSNNAAAGADVFRQRRAAVGYRFEGERLGFELRPYRERIDYLRDDTQDVDVRGVDLGLRYRLRPLLILSFTGTRQRRELLDGSLEDEDTILRLALDRQFTRHWHAMVAVQRRKRDSDLPGFSYEEDAAMLSVLYRR